ncbi:hypothetical protein LJK88_50900 [Paenibacillus sp. P26]|nr:hypothetical protein LJK88_50900 [Paenibacillus sp. P26]
MLQFMEASTTDQWWATWKAFQDKLVNKLIDPALWGSFLLGLIQIALILVIGKITVKIAKKCCTIL